MIRTPGSSPPWVPKEREGIDARLKDLRDHSSRGSAQYDASPSEARPLSMGKAALVQPEKSERTSNFIRAAAMMVNLLDLISE